MRVFLECELSMGPPVCNTQTEHPKVALDLPYRQHLSLSVANWGAHIQFPVNPTFHCQSARTHHLLHQSGSFLLKWCDKNGVERPNSWSETPFRPICPKENGVPKRWKTNLHQICFSKPRMIWYHKGSPPVLFWDEKRPWLGRGGL